MSDFRPGTATPQGVAQFNDEGVSKDDNQVVSQISTQGTIGLYDPLLSTTSHKLPSATGTEPSAHEGILGQEQVSFANEVTSPESRGVGKPMPGDDLGGYERSERPQPKSASDQGKRSGLTRGRSRSQSGSSRRPSGRQAVQGPSTQHYHHSPPPNPQEVIHGAPLGPQGPLSQYQGSTSSPYDQRAGFGGRYTIPPQSPIGMVPTPPQFPYSRGFHPGGAHSPQDSNMLPPNVHPGFQQMLQPHGPVYPYQRHSPEIASPSHPFPGGYSHSQAVSSPPPMSPMSAQSPTTSILPHSATLGPGPQFHTLQFSGTLSAAQYPQYASQAFLSSPPTYPSQYTTPLYPPNFTPSTPDTEGQGTWWYLPHGVPPPSRPFESVQPPYQAHYPMPYHQRRDGDAPYSPKGSAPPVPTPSMMHPLTTAHLGGQQSSRNEQPAQSSSSGGQEQTSPVVEESNILVTGKSKPAAEHIVIRRSYHPNPPAQRSEWVMWAGNVPSDTVHDELWRFFTQLSSRNSTRSASPERGPPKDPNDTLYDGVSSIFLISRSNCAFVNFDTEAHLHSAIDRFNGKPLRPNDPRCPRLVCRVRRKDDDLKAGVGGQRGMGIHTRWIKEKGHKVGADNAATPSTEATSSPTAEQVGTSMAAMSLSSDEERSRPKQSSSGSYASTTSSILTRYFPKRYFILKSLTQFDLDLSVEKGLWATQKHNEGILDQAYRTSAEVYLIFGVNKSGEFYGYAKMAGPVLQGEHRVSWASRTTDSTPSSQSSFSLATGRGSRPAEEAASPGRLLRCADQSNFFSPAEHKLVEESPMPLTTPDKKQGALNRQTEVLAATRPHRISVSNTRNPQSAPAELGPSRLKFPMDTPRAKQSLGTDLVFDYPAATKQQGLPDGFELDPTAPVRAIRNNDENELSSPLQAVAEEDDKPRGQVDDSADVNAAPNPDETERKGWGESFKIEWICTDRLPFYRTRHLRNPWNHDREIKVSRDGTELEPNVGQQLLDDWASIAAESTADVDKGSTSAGRRGQGVPASTTMPPLTVPLERGTPGGKGETGRS